MLASIAERERFRPKVKNIRRDIERCPGGLYSLPSPFGEGLGVRPYPFGLKRDGVKEVKEVSASLEVKDDTLAGDTIGRTNVDNF